jgi:hypothetical protein
MPATIGVFVDPAEDRNAEYDTSSDAYATFLLDELLPRRFPAAIRTPT